MEGKFSETASQQGVGYEDHGLGESEQFTRIYSLPPNFRVEVLDIMGLVEAECHASRRQ